MLSNTNNMRTGLATIKEQIRSKWVHMAEDDGELVAKEEV